MQLHTFIFFKIIYNLSEDKVVWDDLSYKTGTEKTSFFFKDVYLTYIKLIDLKMFFLFLKLRLIHIGGNCMKIDTQSDYVFI